MSPRHGIVVSPGTAIDFSHLARPKSPTSNLLSRATGTNTGLSVVGIIVVVLVAVGLVFCAVLVILILKNKRQKRVRQRKLEESQPMVAHEYRVLDDMESGTTHGPQELSSDGQLNEVELQPDVNKIPGVQQIDGYVAPPRISSEPIELPPDARKSTRGAGA